MWQGLAGEDTVVERILRRQYHIFKSQIEKRYFARNFILFWAGAKRANRIGIYIKGGCHLNALFACQPLIQQVLNGTCCIIHEGSISDSRSDLLLQTLQDLPLAWINPIREKLKLPADYFQPRLFEKTFAVPGPHGPMEFPKTVVIIHIGSDAARAVYQHREHGFLVDPGGWWLNQSIDTVLTDLAVATWFQKHFVRVGKIGIDAFVQNFTKIIELIRKNAGAHILVFNVPSVEPGNPRHTYQFVQNSQTTRHREFNLALVELSRQLDFSIVDIDRILKRAGIKSQMDLGHFPPERCHLIAQEVFRILQELEIF
jgi:hypothetical protein